MKRFGILIAAICVALLFVGSATAAVLPNETAETNGITSTTIVFCDGIVTESTQYCLEHSNQYLDGAPLKGGEVYGVSSYNSRILAVKGETSLVKTANFNDKDQLNDGNNVDVNTEFYFDAADSGRANGEESVAQFNAGSAGQVVGDSQMCPFAEDDNEIISPFNEYTLMGSSFDVRQINMMTDASSTTTAATVDIPSKTSYVVNAEGAGSISGYMNVFAQDSRGDGTYVVTPETTITKKVKDTNYSCYNPKEKTITVPAVISPVTPSAVTSYHDYTSAYGNFRFSKTMSYTSGIA